MKKKVEGKGVEKKGGKREMEGEGEGRMEMERE
jgi:hypothetical protein